MEREIGQKPRTAPTNGMVWRQRKPPFVYGPGPAAVQSQWTAKHLFSILLSSSIPLLMLTTAVADDPAVP